jgi:hypothetical protein
MATQVKPSSYYFRTITDDGIELVVEQIFKGERFFYFADNHTINRNIYHALATGVNLSIKLARATNARGDTTYTADTFPVSEKIYKALGGNVPTCEFTGCGGYVTLAEDRSARIDCTPKPKTRGEEVAEDYVQRAGTFAVVGELYLTPPGQPAPTVYHLRRNLADLLDREIAAAEKRGEEKYKELRSYARSLARSAQINADSNGSFTIHRGSTSYGWAKRIIELTE